MFVIFFSKYSIPFYIHKQYYIFLFLSTKGIKRRKKKLYNKLRRVIDLIFWNSFKKSYIYSTNICVSFSIYFTCRMRISLLDVGRKKMRSISICNIQTKWKKLYGFIPHPLRPQNNLKRIFTLWIFIKRKKLNYG